VGCGRSPLPETRVACQLSSSDPVIAHHDSCDWTSDMHMVRTHIASQVWLRVSVCPSKARKADLHISSSPRWAATAPPPLHVPRRPPARAVLSGPIYRDTGFGQIHCAHGRPRTADAHTLPSCGMQPSGHSDSSERNRSEPPPHNTGRGRLRPWRLCGQRVPCASW